MAVAGISRAVVQVRGLGERLVGQKEGEAVSGRLLRGGSGVRRAWVLGASVPDLRTAARGSG